MKAPKEAVERAKQLRETVAKYRALEHEKDVSPISPEALDSLKHELAGLEAEYPELVTPDSPTQRVAGKPLPELKKVRHQVPQWSLNDAFDENELADFDKRARSALAKSGTDELVTYDAELKIDGLHIILTYEKGRLMTAATRGDGIVGEDVTHNIRTISSVPETLSRKVDLTVEGEVYMTRSGLTRLNKEREKAGEPLFANPRNAAAGSIRQLDPRMAARRPLGVFLYDIDAMSEPFPSTQTGELDYLKSLGLPVNPNHIHAGSIDDIVAYWKKWQGTARDKEDYQLDGVVVKIESQEQQKTLGYTGKAPRFALALKFPAEQVTTILEDISLQVGRTGKLTPVAHLKPVSVAGTTVARATLHNEDFIKEKDIRIGDTVILQKAGDIIPEIVQVLTEFRTGKEKKWRFPKSSPLCGGDGSIERREGEAAHYCSVPGSFEVQSRKIIHFAGKSALDIDGMGRKTVVLLMEHKLVSDPSDIFELTYDELVALPRFAELSAENLIDAIKIGKKTTLPRLLTGLSIPHVGEETAILLAQEFRTLGKLRQAKEEAMANIKGIGDVVAKAAYEWFHDKGNEALTDRLEKQLRLEKIEAPKKGALSGATIVITGMLPTMSREEAETAVRNAGGHPASSVSKNTTFVVAGESAGSKLDKARELGVEVIDETEFKKRIK